LVIRASVWSLIGMIYSPVFVVLRQLLSPALSGYATVLAAAVAGAIGAAFYGARQLALAASLIGVLCATLLLITLGHQAQGWQVAALAVPSDIRRRVGRLLLWPRRWAWLRVSRWISRIVAP